MKPRRSISIALLLVATSSLAQDSLAPLRLAPEDFEWTLGTGNAQVIEIAGDRTAPGMYAYRVRFPSGFRNEPHFHPDNRVVTIIEGTLHVGFGDNFDEGSLRALPAGSLWTEPAEQPHFVWARDGQVVIQVIGYGPSATTQVEP